MRKLWGERETINQTRFIVSRSPHPSFVLTPSPQGKREQEGKEPIPCPPS
jgi:hypothetical protein